MDPTSGHPSADSRPVPVPVARLEHLHQEKDLLEGRLSAIDGLIEQHFPEALVDRTAAVAPAPAAPGAPLEDWEIEWEIDQSMARAKAPPEPQQPMPLPAMMDLSSDAPDSDDHSTEPDFDPATDSDQDPGPESQEDPGDLDDGHAAHDTQDDHLDGGDGDGDAGEDHRGRDHQDDEENEDGAPRLRRRCHDARLTLDADGQVSLLGSILLDHDHSPEAGDLDRPVILLNWTAMSNGAINSDQVTNLYLEDENFGRPGYEPTNPLAISYLRMQRRVIDLLYHGQEGASGSTAGRSTRNRHGNPEGHDDDDDEYHDEEDDNDYYGQEGDGDFYGEEDDFYGEEDDFYGEEDDFHAEEDDFHAEEDDYPDQGHESADGRDSLTHEDGDLEHEGRPTRGGKRSPAKAHGPGIEEGAAIDEYEHDDDEEEEEQQEEQDTADSDHEHGAGSDSAPLSEEEPADDDDDDDDDDDPHDSLPSDFESHQGLGMHDDYASDLASDGLPDMQEEEDYEDEEDAAPAHDFEQMLDQLFDMGLAIHTTADTWADNRPTTFFTGDATGPRDYWAPVEYPRSLCHGMRDSLDTWRFVQSRFWFSATEKLSFRMLQREIALCNRPLSFKITLLEELQRLATKQPHKPCPLGHFDPASPAAELNILDRILAMVLSRSNALQSLDHGAVRSPAAILSLHNRIRQTWHDDFGGLPTSGSL